MFSPSGSDTILGFPYQRGCRYYDGNPPNRGVKCKGGMIKWKHDLRSSAVGRRETADDHDTEEGWTEAC